MVDSRLDGARATLKGGVGLVFAFFFLVSFPVGKCRLGSVRATNQESPHHIMQERFPHVGNPRLVGTCPVLEGIKTQSSLVGTLSG